MASGGPFGSAGLAVPVAGVSPISIYFHQAHLCNSVMLRHPARVRATRICVNLRHYYLQRVPAPVFSACNLVRSPGQNAGVITPENYAPLENGPQSRLHNFRVGVAGPINLRPVFNTLYPKKDEAHSSSSQFIRLKLVDFLGKGGGVPYSRRPFSNAHAGGICNAPGANNKDGLALQSGRNRFIYGFDICNPGRPFFDFSTDTISAAVIRSVSAIGNSDEKDGLYGQAETFAPRPGFICFKTTAAQLLADALTAHRARTSGHSLRTISVYSGLCFHNSKFELMNDFTSGGSVTSRPAAERPLFRTVRLKPLYAGSTEDQRNAAPPHNPVRRSFAERQAGLFPSSTTRLKDCNFNSILGTNLAIHLGQGPMGPPPHNPVRRSYRRVAEILGYDYAAQKWISCLSVAANKSGLKVRSSKIWSWGLAPYGSMPQVCAALMGGTAATSPSSATTGGTELRPFPLLTLPGSRPTNRQVQQGRQSNAHCGKVREADPAAGAFGWCYPLRLHFSTLRPNQLYEPPRRKGNATGLRGGFPTGSFPCEFASLRSSLRTEAAPFLRHAMQKTYAMPPRDTDQSIDVKARNVINLMYVMHVMICIQSLKELRSADMTDKNVIIRAIMRDMPAWDIGCKSTAEDCTVDYWVDRAEYVDSNSFNLYVTQAEENVLWNIEKKGHKPGRLNVPQQRITVRTDGINMPPFIPIFYLTSLGGKLQLMAFPNEQVDADLSHYDDEFVMINTERQLHAVFETMMNEMDDDAECPAADQAHSPAIN